jgi:peptidyl-prolyl cis-trans isomerase SurA
MTARSPVLSALARAVAFVGACCLVFTACTGSQSPATGSGAEERRSPDAVVLARYADSTITVGQFERRYRQTVGDPDTMTFASDSAGIAADSVMADSVDGRMASYRDFLNRYLDFRLKVLAAREAGFDTLTSLRAEASSYRRQIARPTLMRNEVLDPIIRQLYERRQEEVKARHLLIRVPEDATPEDTLAAYREIQTLADSARMGVRFGDLAERHSDDPSARQQGRRGYRGDLGYLTAGQVVEPFETTMYETPVDSISDVFRTRFGYHILTVEDRRPRPQPVRLSHILIRPDSASTQDSTDARRLADSLRTALREGAAFDSLARAYSDDSRSARRGGDLGTVQPSGSLPPPFQEAISNLEVGEVSGVVETRFGYHLIKLTGREARAPLEEQYDQLKQQVSRLPRVEEKEAELAREIRARHGVRVDTTLLLAAAGAPSLDTLGRALLPPTQDPDSAAMTVAALGDSTYSLRRFSRHVAQTQGAPNQPLAQALESFLNERAIDLGAARLEERDPDFAAQMREYREGLLLFQYMQDSVWTAASQDTSFLRSVYRQNRDSYRFPERVRTLVFRAPADTLLAPYAAAYSQSAAEGSASSESAGDASLADLVARAAQDSLVRVDTAFVTDRSPQAYQPMLTVSDGTASGPTEADGEWMYLIRDRTLPARPKSFDEARSAVVRDAQDAYEEQTLQDLRRRYDAELYPERLRFVNM